jgi:hypothetical protein
MELINLNSQSKVYLKCDYPFYNILEALDPEKDFDLYIQDYYPIFTVNTLCVDLNYATVAGALFVDANTPVF